VRPELYHEINNFYTATIYEKGAEVVRMLKVLLGSEKFRAGMDLYFARHDGQAATVEQFIQCFADVSGRDLVPFMRWYSQAGTPEVTVNGHWDAEKKTYRLEATQNVPATPGQPIKEPMVIPFVVGLLGPDGSEFPLIAADGKPTEHGVLTLTRSVETFVFTGIGARPAPSLNRGFSAPIKLVANISAEELGFLAAHDNDPFNRWQAVQTLATGILVDHVAALRCGGTAPVNDSIIHALEQILTDARLEPEFVAQTLVLPLEADIAREIGRDIDPDAILSARVALRAAIGQSLRPLLSETYSRMADAGPYCSDAASAGKRSLKSMCLDLLAADGNAAAIDLAVRQYEAANNMTDRIAALATLSLHDVPQRTQALEDFYSRYSGDPLIIDKWFALQAGIAEPGTLARVRALTAHPAFSLSNPNRVRALIGVFAQGNPTQFNRADGEGYDFVVENVLALDEKNPQVAARLLSAFKSWRALELQRQTLARAALQRVTSAPTLSRDVGDIVQRTLAEPT
jgi:aminopeptidase N